MVALSNSITGRLPADLVSSPSLQLSPPVLTKYPRRAQSRSLCRSQLHRSFTSSRALHSISLTLLRTTVSRPSQPTTQSSLSALRRRKHCCSPASHPTVTSYPSTCPNAFHFISSTRLYPLLSREAPKSKSAMPLVLVTQMVERAGETSLAMPQV